MRERGAGTASSLQAPPRRTRWTRLSIPRAIARTSTTLRRSFAKGRCINRLPNCGTLVRDEDGVARPASVQAGAHPRDFHEKSVEAETLFELPVVPRGPDGQRSAGTECGKGSGNAGIVVESGVVGGRERRRAA